MIPSMLFFLNGFDLVDDFHTMSVKFFLIAVQHQLIGYHLIELEVLGL